MVESSIIVGGVVYDFLCVSYADVDCIHYLSCEVAPVKYLQSESESTKREKEHRNVDGSCKRNNKV